MKQFYRCILIVACFMLYVSHATAQKSIVNGIVLDSSGTEPVVGAYISINNKPLAVTNGLGKYSFELDSGTYIFSISYVGFEPYTDSIRVGPGTNTLPPVTLKNAPSELGTFVVSGSRYNKNINTETISMDVVSAQFIKNTNAIDVSEAMNRVPGVTITDGQASIRGGAGYSYGVGSRVNFLMDGVPLIASDLGNVEWNLVPIENIAQVEVMKGASSVFYGSGSLNGVINVITAWPGEKPSTTISTYAQIIGDPPRPETRWWAPTDQPMATGVFFNHSRQINKNVDLVIGGNFHADRSYLEGNSQMRGRINFKTRFRHPKIKGLSYGLNGNFMFERAGRFVLWKDGDTNIYRKTFGSDDKYYFLIIDPHVSYYDKKGNKHNVTMRYYRKFRYGFDGDIDAVSNNMLIDYQYQRKFFKNMFTITAGGYANYGWVQSNLFPDSLQIDTNTGQPKKFFQTISAAAFAQLEFNYRRWSVVGGVRYEVNGADMLVEASMPVFRGGINFRAAKKTYLRASFGQSYRLPSLGERFIKAELISGFSVLPNYSLRPEKGWSAEIGVRQGYNITKNWTGYGDFAAYWMEFTDMIQYNVGFYPPDGIGYKAFNIPRARVAGFELTAGGQGYIGPVMLNVYAGYNYTFPANLSGYEGLNNAGVYLDSMFASFGRPLLGQPNDSLVLPFRNRHSVRADIEVGWNNITLGTTLYYLSTYDNIDKNFEFIEVAIYRFISPWKESHINSTGDFTADVRASYTFKKINTKLSFLVKNCTNQEVMARPGIMNPPRSFNLRLDVNF